MDNDYYSLNAILAENHKLQCTFPQDLPGMGYLEGGTEVDLAAGTRLELPIWLVQTLAMTELVTFVVPQPYNKRVESAVKAGASSLRVSSLVGAGGWWYRFGAKLGSMWENGDHLLGWLLKALTERLPALQDLAAHQASAESMPEGTAGTGEAFREGMEADERELFLVGQESGRAVKVWYDSEWGRRR